jgi:hypothetical protein
MPRQPESRDAIKLLVATACYSVMLDLDQLQRDLELQSLSIDRQQNPAEWMELCLAQRLIEAEREHQQRVIAISSWYRERARG